ncbi:MAG TPA: hypothetical protein VLB51_07025 [Methylomirabilota bacterium]|nr:hypothetical protein [Methylomirabilota bacterium]
MTEQGASWFRGCGLGCVGLAVIGVIAVVGMTVSLRSGFDEAHARRQQLEQRSAGGTPFTPAADGTIPADRVEAFLAVREALAPVCAELEARDDEAEEFERLADEEASPKVALPVILRLTRSMMGLPFLFAELESVRNQALLETGMGLEEYTWLYIVVYHDQLAQAGAETRLLSGSADNERIRADLRALLHRQLEAARAASLGDAWLGTLAAEVHALDLDPDCLPWQDGLPEPVEASLAPYRERLDAAFSAASAEFELLNSTVRHGGLNIQLN